MKTHKAKKIRNEDGLSKEEIEKYQKYIDERSAELSKEVNQDIAEIKLKVMREDVISAGDFLLEKKLLTEEQVVSLAQTNMVGVIIAAQEHGWKIPEQKKPKAPDQIVEEFKKSKESLRKHNNDKS